MELTELKDKILNGVILGSEAFKEFDLDEILDGREESSFDKAWVDASKSLGKLGLEGSERQIIDSIREVSFKAVYKHCEDPDLSAEVSDDFGLIAKAFCFNLDNSFINSLWLCYKTIRYREARLSLFMVR